MEIIGLDETDNRIVNLLLADGRMSYSDIGDEVGLSRVAVKNRIRVLESKGIIKGYKAIIDPQAELELTTFVVNIDVSAESFEEAKEYLNAAKEVITMVQTTGECHLLAICLVKNIASMRNFVNTTYKAFPGIQRITAHSVLDIIKGRIIPDM